MRVMVQVEGRVNLLQLAFVEHTYPRSHRHRLDLIMGHVNEGRLQPLMQATNEGTRFYAQLGVEIGERLIHEEDRRFAYDGAANCHALTLTAGQLPGAAIQQVTDAQFVGSLIHALINDFLWRLAQLETECHVIIDGHMRIQGVTLEHHGHIAVFRRDIVDHAITDQDFALGNLFQACQHPQTGGLAAAGRPDEDQKLLVLDFNVQIGYNALITEIL